MEPKGQILAMGVRRAAQMIDSSHWTIRKLIRDGKLKATRFNGRVLIEPAELQKLIAKGRQTQSQ